MLEPAFGVPARRPTVSVTAPLAAVLEAAVDAPARPDGAAVPDAAAYGVYPLIILIVYVIVTGGILCSDHCGRSLLLTDLRRGTRDAKPDGHSIKYMWLAST